MTSKTNTRPSQKKLYKGNDSTMRLIGYVRVSTDDQASHGVSLAAQEQRLRAHAEAHGYILQGVARDEGVSGKVPPLRRPGLRSALEAVNAGAADGLVFLKLDRLSRSVRDILKLADEAKRSGWHLLSVSEHIDTSTAAGKFTLGVLALLAEMERDQLGERTRLGMQQVARENRSRSSRLPFGYRVSGAPEATVMKAGDRRPLVEDASEMRLLRLILRQRAKGLGAQRIAKGLNSKDRGNPRTKKPWTTSTVAAILRTAARRADRPSN